MRAVLLSSLILLNILFLVSPAYAIVDPLSVPNNKIGIHILFPSELDNAAKLVNSSGGDWGYVTIPIQTGDKDMVKWQNFMDDCARLHIIPLIRLATEGDYFNTLSWRKPNYDDIIDFANFLDSLNWPTKNRYIIVYNEVNRGDEYGGSVDPADYAKLLDYAVKEFKYVNPDFFIISAGLDNAAPNQGTDFMQEYSYMSAMNQAVPGIFSEIDGLASHSYPNPGFSAPPTVNNRESIYSFSYEQKMAQELDGKNLPVFITETGWSNNYLADQEIAGYYQQAFSQAWSDPSIVAVTPFLLDAGQGSFVQFSFMKSDGSPSPEYQAVLGLAKVKGKPILNNTQVLSISTTNNKITKVKNFNNDYTPTSHFPTLADNVRSVFKWLFKL